MSGSYFGATSKPLKILQTSVCKYKYLGTAETLEEEAAQINSQGWKRKHNDLPGMTKVWFKRPSKSPDLNSIENEWIELESSVRRNKQNFEHSITSSYKAMSLNTNNVNG